MFTVEISFSLVVLVALVPVAMLAAFFAGALVAYRCGRGWSPISGNAAPLVRFPRTTKAAAEAETPEPPRKAKL